MKYGAGFLIGMLLAAGVFAKPAESVAIAPLTLMVTDAETGAALSDVLVVVTHPLFVKDGWNLHEGVYYTQSGDVMITEAVTGDDGNVHFPAMHAARPSSEQLLEDDAPLLLLYKPGYVPRLLNDARGTRGDRALRRVPAKLDSSWNGKSVTLEPASGPIGTHAADILVSYLEGGQSGRGPDCQWRQMPTLYQRLETAATGNPTLEKRVDWIRRSNPCGYGRANALQWQDPGEKLELHIALSRVEHGKSAFTSVPRDGDVLVIVKPGDAGSARGVLFIRQGDDNKRRQLRIDGKIASTELPGVKAGERIEVDFLDLGGNRIRRGAIETRSE